MILRTESCLRDNLSKYDSIWIFVACGLELWLFWISVYVIYFKNRFWGEILFFWWIWYYAITWVNLIWLGKGLAYGLQLLLLSLDEFLYAIWLKYRSRKCLSSSGSEGDPLKFDFGWPLITFICPIKYQLIEFWKWIQAF